MLVRPLEQISYGSALSATAAARQMDLVPFPSWRRARDQACAVLLKGEKLVLVTGSSGTGKTLLLEDVARILRTAGWRASFHVSGAKLEDELAGGGGRSALLVDDADQLSEAELAAASAPDHRPVLLAGSELLARRCPGARSIALHALEFDEAREFIRLWEAGAGIDEPLDAAAVLRLFGVSAGIPRLLAILLNAGIWHRAGAEETPSVPPRTQEPQGPAAGQFEALSAPAATAKAMASKRARSRRPRRAVGGGLLLALLLGAGGALAPERYWPASLLPLRTQVWNEAQQLSSGAGVQLAPLYEAVSRQLGRSMAHNAEAKSRPERISTPDLGQGADDPIARTQAEIPPSPPEISEMKPAADAAPPLNPSLPAPASPFMPTPEPEKAIATTTPTEPATPPVLVAALTPSAAVAALTPSAAVAEEAPPARAPVQDQLTSTVVELLLRRGNEMMLLGDYSAARLLFQRAVSAGSREAMVPLGRTYDGAALTGYGAQTNADAVIAAQWYRQAAAAGVPGAADLLRTIEQQASR